MPMPTRPSFGLMDVSPPSCWRNNVSGWWLFLAMISLSSNARFCPARSPKMRKPPLLEDDASVAVVI